MTLAFILLIGFGAGLQAAGASPQPDPSLIRVRIETDEGGDPAELAARRESVKHLAAAITSRKKSGLVVMTSADDSVDVVIEVEGRGVTVPKVVIGLSGGMGSSGGRAPQVTQPVRIVQLRVTVGMARDGDPSEITNKNRANETESGWKSAADDVAKQVEKWIADHRAAILKARLKPRPTSTFVQ